MPVWHELTRTWRESGELAVLGITQEQHPERCELFAQWKAFDWPILWDPLNLTGSAAVPRFIAIDEHGVVRSTRPNPNTFGEEFVHATFEAPGQARPARKIDVRADLLTGAPSASMLGEFHRAYADILFGEPGQLDSAIATLEELLDDPVQDPKALFRVGVALRMRFDSSAHRVGDFQSALDYWQSALDRDPNQYIWRRRIEQYGPGLEKPYPFYPWVDQAIAEIRDRGDTPVELGAPLTGSERLGRTTRDASTASQVVEPDPEGQIRRANEGWITVETAVALGRHEPRSARAHVALQPAPKRDIHWNNETSPLRVWISAPEGWVVTEPLVEHPNPGEVTSNERRHVDFEVFPPEGASGSHRLKGYALFNACEGETGTCMYLRREFEVSIRLR